MKDKLNQEVAKYADANLRLSELLQAVNDANEKLASSVK